MVVLAETGMSAGPHGNGSVQVASSMSANAISLPLTEGCVGANGDIIGDMHVTVLSKGWGRQG